MIMGIIGDIFFIIGSTVILLLIPLINISPTDPYLKKILISLDFSVYFTISVIYVSILDLSILENRLIALLSAIGFTIMLMSLYKLVFPYLDLLSHTEPSKVS